LSKKIKGKKPSVKRSVKSPAKAKKEAKKEEKKIPLKKEVVKVIKAKTKTQAKTKTKAKKVTSSPASNKTKKFESSKKENYKFKNFYESETQLKNITEKSSPETIFLAFERLISVNANNHVREGVEFEDLVAEANAGLVEVISEITTGPRNKKKKKRNYNFQQACLYRIRQKIFQYCLRNANQIKTPYYIQRGCMHVGQIFKLMGNQSTAEFLLGKKGHATENEIIQFIFDENERLPLKPMKFIKAQIKKDPKSKEFSQILSGVLNHELGSRHSFVKNNLTDIGKILHIKQKLWFTADSNNMNYQRVISLILSARQTKVELTPLLYTPHYNNLEDSIISKELIGIGKKVCGELEFNIFVANKVMDKTYDEVSTDFNIKKSVVVETIKECIRRLRKDEDFKEYFNSSTNV